MIVGFIQIFSVSSDFGHKVTEKARNTQIFQILYAKILKVRQKEGVKSTNKSRHGSDAIGGREKEVVSHESQRVGSFSFAHSEGEHPSSLAKVREKVIAEENPDSSATSRSFISGCSRISLLASRMR